MLEKESTLTFPEETRRNVHGATDGTYWQESEFQEANISQTLPRIADDGENSHFSGDLDANARGYWTLVFVASAAGLLFGLLLVYSKYRKKRILKQSYEEFPEPQAIRPKLTKAIDSSMYNYACPQRSIDFVVPSIASTSLQNPTDATSETEVPSPERNATSWTNLELFEGGATLLGGLNPELYKAIPEDPPEEVDFPEGNQGRLWFGTDYDASAERLVVTLVKAKNLPSRVYGSINCCDPFVRIYLMPDERRYLQSKLKKKTSNPRFEETFVFQVPSQSEEERTLKFTVYDNDRGKHHNVIGHVVLPLSEIRGIASSNSPALRWSDLQKDGGLEIPCDLGQIMLSLCYNQSLERLIVTVCEAKSLRLVEGFKVKETYAKLILMKENKSVKSKKTMSVKNSRDPKYNESFHFRLPRNAVHSASVIVQVTQAGGKEKDKILGRVILGSYMFSRGKGLEHWDEAISAGHKQIRYWHKLV